MNDLGIFVPLRGPFPKPKSFIEDAVKDLLECFDDWQFISEGQRVSISAEELPDKIWDLSLGMRGRWQIVLGSGGKGIPEPSWSDGRFRLSAASSRFEFAVSSGVVLLEEWGTYEHICYGLYGGSEQIARITQTVLPYACRHLRTGKTLLDSTFAIGCDSDVVDKEWLYSDSSDSYLRNGAHVVIWKFWWEKLLDVDFKESPFGDQVAEVKGGYGIWSIADASDLRKLWKLVRSSNDSIWFLPPDADVKRIVDHGEKLINSDCFSVGNLLSDFPWMISPSVSEDYALVLYDADASRLEDTQRGFAGIPDALSCVW